MSVEEPIKMLLVGFGEVIGSAQEGETGFGTGPARTLGDADQVRGVVSLGVPG